jgi:hypothetical protein
MGEFKRHKLHSGSKKGPEVKSRKQAVAIALSQAGLSKKQVEEENKPVVPSAGLQGRIVQEPTKPAKTRDDSSISNPPKETSTFSGSTVKSMQEAVIQEIRGNLEEQLAEAYLDSDPTVFENFVDSLTEEQIDILGLSEETGIGGGFSGIGRALGNIGSAAISGAGKVTGAVANKIFPGGPPKTFSTTPTQAPPAATKPGGDVTEPIPAPRPLPSLRTATPPQAQVAKPSALGPLGKIVPATTQYTSSTAQAQTAPSPAAPAVTPKPASTTAPQKTSTSKPASSSDSTSDWASKALNSVRSGPTGSGSTVFGLNEEVKPQIKQSLESFLRTRFMKG